MIRRAVKDFFHYAAIGVAVAQVVHVIIEEVERQRPPRKPPRLCICPTPHSCGPFRVGTTPPSKTEPMTHFGPAPEDYNGRPAGLDIPAERLKVALVAEPSDWTTADGD